MLLLKERHCEEPSSSCHCEADFVSRSNLGGLLGKEIAALRIRSARNDNGGEARNDK